MAYAKGRRPQTPVGTASRVQLCINATTAPGSATFGKTTISDMVIAG